MLPAETGTDDVADLYRRYAPALHRRCASIVRNSDEAHDLVQETFARFLAAREQGENRHSPFGVLYRIATNASIDRLRRRTTASEESLDPEIRSGDHDSPRVDSVHDLALLTRGLSEDELTVAVLYHLDGYTHDEIADALDISRRTVGKILRRFELHTRKRAARLGLVPAQGAGDG